MFSRRRVVSLALFLSLVVAPPPQSRGAEPIAISTRSPLLVRVDRSIASGVKYLLAQQSNDGSFGVKGEDHLTGKSALVTLALLSCGESNQSPQMLKAIEFLRKNRSTRTYDAGLRACVFASLPDSARGAELKVDLNVLLNSIKNRSDDSDGMYSYDKGDARGGDFSNSQYGVLGVWYATSLGGLEVPENYWRKVEGAWKRGQVPDGGWSYTQDRGTSRASMTAAGAATLYITNDYLHAADARDLTIPVMNKELDRAMAWLGERFAVDRNVGLSGGREPDGTWVYYTLFGYERVGEASGLTRFGEHNWFEEGAKQLVETQAENGSWSDPRDGSIVGTSYALLFLSRGRSPVLVQKLQFNQRWNNRPRDAANYVKFMRHATEKHVNWQIVSIDAPPAEIREAPILYAASDRAFELNEEQKQKLADYVNEGGTLVLVNEGETDGFARNAIAICKQLWPAYSFRDIPENHPIRTANFPMANWTSPIRGLSNGVREMVILFPSGDASWRWQSSGGAITATLSPFAPLANLFLYLTDKTPPRFKGEHTWIERDASVGDAPRAATIARLRHNGNWDPEPLGWKRLSNILHNAQAMELTTRAIDIDDASFKTPFALAHLACAGTFTFTPAQQASLKKYLDSGGLLLFDAAGGSSEAALSFEALMAQMYPDAKAQVIPPDHPIFAGKFDGGESIETVSYRRAPGSRLPPSKMPRLRGYTIGGKMRVIQSSEDISASLVGYTTAGVTGYSPSSAVEVMRNVILWARNARQH